mgnify:CR=1 FL=1
MATIVEERAIGETSFMATFLADGGHFLYLFSHRDQVDQIAKLVAFEVTIQSGNYDCATIVGDPVYDKWKFFAKKLSFVYPDDLSLFVFRHLKQRCVKLRDYKLCLVLYLIVSHHASVTTVVALI